ncbi:MAG TPA: adenylate/guanylate cyclase domain-containing protein [Geminicoccaceae bacterium]|nr:adenylate/guanylate cyclase domain-containing protein [Geminicoccaceae bacterium]
MAGRPMVLIVDDEPFNVDLLEQELELLDYATVAAADGRQALERLAAEPIDLVLLDIMMPELDGYQVLLRIKADPGLRHIPVIMVSALSELDSVVRCIELGAEDHLPKPFEPVLLRARVGACLEKKRLHDHEREHLAEIDRQRGRAEALLHAILPAAAVEELIRSGSVAPRRHDEVVVMFADVVGFTGFCETHAPEEVVESLHRLALGFEELTAWHGLEKIKTVGDALMATAGLLVPSEDPVMASLRCAAATVAAARALPSRWEMRIGIHIGPVVAGVLGREKFSYDLWGDTVNVTARLAAFGTEPGIHLSAAAWRRVADRARAIRLGPVPIKGKGEMEVWRLELPVG